MSGPELPVIYENPRFDKATPTLWPVFNRAFRFGAVLMLEWGTLTLVEDTPRYLKYATVVIAVLALAVHESWPWLRMRGKYWYPSLMGVLIVGYLGIFAYADLFASKHPSTQAAASSDDADLKTRFAKQSSDLEDAQRDARRWTFVYNLRNGARAPNGEFLSCKYALVLGGGNEPWTLWTALQAMLDLAHWSADATNQAGTTNLQLPRGLTILTGNNANAFSCGTSLGRAFGSAYPLTSVQLRPNSVTSHLIDCKHECVELDIGG